MNYKSSKIALLILSAILGIPAGLLVIFSAITISNLKINTYLGISNQLTLPQAQIISLAVIIVVWYFVSKRFYTGDKKLLITGFLVLIIVSFASINFALDLTTIGPKGEQIPMMALIFRGYELEDKIVTQVPWQKYDWSFYEPRGYKEKFSRNYKDKIYIASFYYQEQQKAGKAFEEYSSSLILHGFNKSGSELEVNETRKFALIDSFALENSDFIYGELIGAKEGYLPGNSYIIVIKSGIDEKQLVEAMVK
ncbi:Uncharacterised protein [uncultured archaeon]|nr:Uncharacterised protein [uncultured archaeon]